MRPRYARRVRVRVLLVLLVGVGAAIPAAAAECPDVDPATLLADSQASFVGLLLDQTGDEARFLVQEVVTGPLEEGTVTVRVVGEPYRPRDDVEGVYLNRGGGEWLGDGCAVTSADELRAVGPGGGSIVGDSEFEEPPYSLLLIPTAVIVIGVLVTRWRARRHEGDEAG